MKISPKTKEFLDTALRGGLALTWIIGTFIMLGKFIGYEADTQNVTLAWQASVCGVVVIAAISTHAYLVDLKMKEGRRE
jgi:hypothetical protein